MDRSRQAVARLVTTSMALAFAGHLLWAPARAAGEAVDVPTLAEGSPTTAASAEQRAAIAWLVGGLARGGTRGPGGVRLFPADLAVLDVRARGAALDVVVRGTFEPATGDAGLVLDEARREVWLGALAAAGIEGGVRAWRRDDDGTAPLFRAGGPPAPHALAPRAVPPRAAGGALAGKRIGVSAGHGFLADGAGRYATQRERYTVEGCPTCRGIVEDLFTAELVTRQLLPLLEGMGAEVVLVREPDPDTEPAHIVDDSDATYHEEGAWRDGTSAGGLRGTYRAAVATGAATAEVFLPPAVGRPRLALRFVGGANRASRVTIEIDDDGGLHTREIDQTRDGRHWRDLGPFSFAAGGAVRVMRGAVEGVVIADAVKRGGGIHAEARQPWWQMAARSYVPAAEPASPLGAENDVTIRPAYASALGVDAYVSIHANASGIGGGSTASGLTTYRYSCGTFEDHASSTTAAACDLPRGSTALLEAVHASMLARIHQGYDPAFRDRAGRVADFGELRGLTDAPGVLVEAGFFDNLRPSAGATRSDNEALHDPRFREALAAGIADGLARFFEPTAHAPPDRPVGLAARVQGDALLLTWRAVAGATGYRVFHARDGLAFDDGIVVAEPRLALPNLERGVVHALRVSALDDNGQGRASAVVVARAAREATDPRRALVVIGYDRRDARVQDVDNDLTTALLHGLALAASDASLTIDSALDEQVEDPTAPWDPLESTCRHASLSIL